MIAAALTVIAIVAQDPVALRAAPKESASINAQLIAGDALEIRGEHGDFLQVYDHRRERAGYVKANLVRQQSLRPEAANELATLARFLKDSPGAETLGMAYAHFYQQVTPTTGRDLNVDEALLVMGDRLSRRATLGSSNAKQADLLQQQLTLARSYGVNLQAQTSDPNAASVSSPDASGATTVYCNRSDTALKLLAPTASLAQQTQAALSLTRLECVPRELAPKERIAYLQNAAELLGSLQTRWQSPTDRSLSAEPQRSRVRIRLASINASLAFQASRLGDTELAQRAGRNAITTLASVSNADLSEADPIAYQEAAVRVGASRWAAAPGADDSPRPANAPIVQFSQQANGETCVQISDAKPNRSEISTASTQRCTWGIVWQQSLSIAPTGDTLTLAVQPLETWRELWLIRKTAQGWQIDPIPPGLNAPNLGYLEFAGWLPNAATPSTGPQFLAARETLSNSRLKTSFEVIDRNTLSTEKQAENPAHLTPFYRWQSPHWKRTTVAVRG